MSGSGSNINGFELETISLEDLAEYLKNKSQGGRNFEKGHIFENKYAILRIAESLSKHLKSGNVVQIDSQRENFFVDDLVIESNDRRRCWQLKNVEKISLGQR